MLDFYRCVLETHMPLLNFMQMCWTLLWPRARAARSLRPIRLRVDPARAAVASAPRWLVEKTARARRAEEEEVRGPGAGNTLYLL